VIDIDVAVRRRRGFALNRHLYKYKKLFLYYLLKRSLKRVRKIAVITRPYINIESAHNIT